MTRPSQLRALNPRKGQIKMFETISVLVVFFFLLVFGMTFYFSIQESSFQEQKSRIAQLLSIQIAQKISYLPELDCVLVGVQKENCFDKHKLLHFNQTLSSNQAKVDYFPLFEFSTLTVKEVYPGDETYVLYDRPSQIPSFTVTQVPILLYDSIQDTFSFGVLEVKVYES